MPSCIRKYLVNQFISDPLFEELHLHPYQMGSREALRVTKSMLVPVFLCCLSTRVQV